MLLLLAGALGFEPRKYQSQSLAPYRLAMPQYMRELYGLFCGLLAILPPTLMVLSDLIELATFGWGRWIRTIGMQESKSCALPLGDTPIFTRHNFCCFTH